MSVSGSSLIALGRRMGLARFVVVAVAIVVVACGGAGGGGGDGASSSGGAAPPTVAMAALQVLNDGFAFANFPSSWYEDEFGAEDLVEMFGSDPSVCIDGVADPCELTAEAAAFARLVNQSRAAGHCEGLAVVAQARFNATADPPTSQLVDDSETIRAIMRGFATQFLPEVRDEVGKWLKSSLDEKVAALANSLAEGTVQYSLGVYDEYGGHAVLPYAVEYRSPKQVRIMVYDSNWPGRNRFVDVDLDKKTWSFSFSGDDPENDPDIWTGGPSRMDLTSIDARSGSCPFCEGSVGVTKNALLVRSSEPDWSIEVGGETVTATSPITESGDVEVTPFKAQGGSGNRPSYDYLILIPNTSDGERAKLTLPGTSSVFALTPSGIAQISSPGNPDVPVEVGPTSFVSSDPAVTLSLAAGNLVASASGPTASLEIKPEGLTAAVTTADGQVVEVAVTPETPAAKIEADPVSGGIQVLAQASTGIVERRDIASDGSVTVTIETTPLNLNATKWEAPPGLESVTNPSLPSPEARNLANPDYKADAPYTPPAEAVPAKEAAATPPASAAPATAAPATAAPATAAPATAAPATAAPATAAPATQAPATQAPATQPPATQPPATQPPATQAPATQPPATQPPATQAPVTQPPATSPPVAAPPPPPPTTTTTSPPIMPALAFPEFPSLTYGQGPVIVVVFTNSPAPLSFSVSNPSVASISSTTTNSAQIALVGAGSTTFTVTQSATTGYAAGTFSRTLTVDKAAQSALTVDSASGATGQLVELSATGGTTGGTISFTLTENGGGSCTLSGNQLSRGSDGTCTVTATRLGNSNYEDVTSAPRTIEFVSVVHGMVNEGGILTLHAPAGTRFSSVVFASYGTPTGTPGNFTQGGCHAATSVTKVAELALLQTSVTINASNGVFGDPCGGTYKHLYVSLAFVPIGSNSTGLLLYEVTNPKRAGSAIQYTSGYGTGAGDVAATFDALGRQITRVIYRMEVVVDGVLRYAEVSFDPWAGLTGRGLRIPDLLEANRFTIQRYVENMAVESNMSSTVSAKSTGVITGSGRRGYLEIWPWNYDTWPTAGGPSGGDGYDYNDSPTVGGGQYGSFQVHDVTDPNANRTVLAWNRHGECCSADIGLGDYKGVSGTHLDWTFTGDNGLGSTNWKLQIRVEWSQTTSPQSLTAAACSLFAGAGTNGGATCDKAFVMPGAGNTAAKYYDYGSAPFSTWLDFGGNFQISQLQIWTADDSGTQSHRNPTFFTLYSSNAGKTTVSAVASGSVTCPTADTAPCSVINLALDGPHRYLIVEFMTQAGTSQFQISRAIFSGVSVSAEAGASTVSTSNDDEVRDETDESIDESVPEQDEAIDENDESGELDDPTSPDPSEPEPNDDDEIFVDGGLLVGVLALGARADRLSNRLTTRRRRRRIDPRITRTYDE